MPPVAGSSACLVLAGLCFLLGLASELLRALAESSAAWGAGRELNDTMMHVADNACLQPSSSLAVTTPCRMSGTPTAAHASSEPVLPADRSDDRSALAQLRAAGEAAWGGGLPAALDDEVQTQPPNPNHSP